MTLATNPDPAGNPGLRLPDAFTGAPTPAAANVAGGFPMTETRERELLRAVPTLRCRGQIEGFRAQLAEQGEKPTGALESALVRQAGRVR